MISKSKAGNLKPNIGTGPLIRTSSMWNTYKKRGCVCKRIADVEINNLLKTRQSSVVEFYHYLLWKSVPTYIIIRRYTSGSEMKSTLYTLPCKLFPLRNARWYCYRFGVICAFATNEVLEEGVTNLPKNVRTAFTDTELYINNTKKVRA